MRLLLVYRGEVARARSAGEDTLFKNYRLDEIDRDRLYILFKNWVFVICRESFIVSEHQIFNPCNLSGFFWGQSSPLRDYFMPLFVL